MMETQRVDAYTRNRPAWDWLGVTKWHHAGYTGKGVKIVVVDTDINKAFCRYPERVFPQAGAGNNFGTADGKTSFHGGYSVDIVQQILPHAEVHFFRWQSGLASAVRHAISIGAAAVSVSLSYDWAPISRELSAEALEAGVLLCASAGNSGQTVGHQIGFPARKATWVAVGAAFVNIHQRTIGRAVYSSTGDALEVMGYTGRWVDVGSSRQIQYTGTSCACPVFASMMGLVRERWPYMTVQEKRNLILDHSVDMAETGRDEETGWGMFRLPHPETGERMKEIVLTIDDKAVIVDGERVETDVAPMIHNGRTMVPVSFVARQLGKEVTWDEHTRRVIIRG